LISDVFQDILVDILKTNRKFDLYYSTEKILELFNSKFRDLISTSEKDTEVVGYKSIAAYRTGLAVSTSGSKVDIERSLCEAVKSYYSSGRRDFRLQYKAFNDHLVRIALDIARKPGKISGIFYSACITDTLCSSIPHRLG
jgi:hypothetical protein